jgi:alpha-tubulin suppressor-like RCC1 family protein
VGCDGDSGVPLGQGEARDCPIPKPIESLRGIKVDAVAAAHAFVLVLADNGNVYAWGAKNEAAKGALGLGAIVRDADEIVRSPQRTPALCVACGL